MVSASGYLIAAGIRKVPCRQRLSSIGGTSFILPGRGRTGYDEIPRDFAKLIWQLASPKWDFDDATFDRAQPPSTTRIMSHRDP